MRILLDTNIIILREDNKVIQEDLQILMKIIQKLDYKILVHPKSIEDIKRDTDEERRKVTLSKFKAYDSMEVSPDPRKNRVFTEITGAPKNDNDLIDDYLLYSIYKNAVNFLITEDGGIHKKAYKLRISERVLNVLEALDLFKKDLPKDVRLPPALYKTTMADLNVNDPIFDTLREDYQKFNDWYARKSTEGRECWIYRRNNGSLGAVLIYKFEEEIILSEPPLEQKRRIKIATMKVSHVGHKIGELLLKLSFELAINNDIPEIYLTHFTRENDFLVDLIKDYGFRKVSIIKREWTEVPEDVFVKKIFIQKGDIEEIPHVEISKQYYPNFYDGVEVKKFIIPIQPGYFKKLFTDFPIRQTTMDEHLGEFIIEGNTIKKAYLSQANIKKMEVGDLLLFYRSIDVQSILSIGVIEQIDYDMRDPAEIISIVGKRTVFSSREIEEISQKNTIVILFNHLFHLNRPIKFKKLLEMGILHGPPQSISEIEHGDYIRIKKVGGIDERFTFD